MNQPTPEEFLAQPDTEEYEVGDSVTVGGVDFTKIAEPFTASPDAVWQLPPSTLERIAEGVEQLVEHFTTSGKAAAAHLDGQIGVTSVKVEDSAEVQEALGAAREAVDDTEDKLRELTEVLTDVEAALGKSTAKPVLAAKAVIEAYRNPQVIVRFHDEAPSEGYVPDEPGPVLQASSGNPADAPYVPETFEDELPAHIEESMADPEYVAAVVPSVIEPPEHSAPVEEWRTYARAIGYAGPEIDTANRSQIRTALGVAQPVAGA